MSSEAARTLAEQIVRVLKGTGYYADPAELAPLLRPHVASDAKAAELAQSVVTESLRRFSRSYLSASDVESEAAILAGLLSNGGVGAN